MKHIHSSIPKASFSSLAKSPLRPGDKWSSVTFQNKLCCAQIYIFFYIGYITRGRSVAVMPSVRMVNIRWLRFMNGGKQVSYPIVHAWLLTTIMIQHLGLIDHSVVDGWWEYTSNNNTKHIYCISIPERLLSTFTNSYVLPIYLHESYDCDADERMRNILWCKRVLKLFDRQLHASLNGKCLFDDANMSDCCLIFVNRDL